MNLSKLTGIVRDKIAITKGVRIEEISAHSSIKDDLGVASMEYILILTDVATALGIDLMTFSEKEIINAVTVGDLEQVIASKLTLSSEA